MVCMLNHDNACFLSQMSWSLHGGGMDGGRVGVSVRAKTYKNIRLSFLSPFIDCGFAWVKESMNPALQHSTRRRFRTVLKFVCYRGGKVIKAVQHAQRAARPD